MIDAYRIDNVTPASKFPYRCSVNGTILRTKAGGVRKFRTLDEACAAGKKIERAHNPLKRIRRVRLHY